MSPSPTPSMHAEAIVQTIRQPLLVLDASLHVRSVNSGFCRTFRVTPDESLGKSVFALGNGQWNTPRLRQLLEEILPHDTTVEDFEIHQDFPIIGKRSVLLNARRLEASPGEEPLILLAIEDVTSQREAAHALEAYARELKRSNEDLQSFAHIASHDLQEPLRTLSSYSQLLARRYGDQLDDKGLRYLDFMLDASNRMQRLIRDLLAYSRVQDDDGERRIVDLNACAQEALRRLVTLVQETDAEVAIDPLPSVRADAGQMAQLFQNLVSNALKYRSEEAPNIRITATKGEGQWRFAVRDNGIGVAAEYHERIFGVFRRLHGPRHSDGTGIGLPLCRRIVERHGGTLWLESTPGTGTTFYFTLPLDHETETRS